MKYYAILVAGGSGNRMQSKVAKQFLLLDGKPVMMHTLEAFYSSTLQPELLIVLNAAQQDYWQELCQKHGFTIPHKIIPGGEQRFHSVKNGITAINGPGIVAVHDAVRPLISPKLITESFEVAKEKGNCVVGYRPTDSIRKMEKNGEHSISYDRNEFILVQTPQTFNLDILRKAYEQPYRNEFTDDASVVECYGCDINIIEGERENIKITYPIDLEMASLFKSKKGS